MKCSNRYADSSDDTIPEELSKHVEYVWDGDIHLFIANLMVSFSVSRRRHNMESLNSLMAKDTAISSNTLMCRFIPDWLQNPKLFIERLLLCHVQLMTPPSTSLNRVIFAGKMNCVPNTWRFPWLQSLSLLLRKLRKQIAILGAA